MNDWRSLPLCWPSASRLQFLPATRVRANLQASSSAITRRKGSLAERVPQLAALPISPTVVQLPRQGNHIPRKQKD